MPNSERFQNEIEHGKYIKEHTSGEFWYWKTPAGQKRLKRRCEIFTAELKPGFNVLEVGCGTGLITQALAKSEVMLTAIDISPDLLNIAKNNLTTKNVEFDVANACELTYGSNSFDVIIGSSILHHLDVPLALAQFFKILKPGGYILFTEPNMINPHVFIERRFRFFRRVFYYVSLDETAFIRWQLEKTLHEHGFRDIKIIPHDFLHPMTPKTLIRTVESLGLFLEKIPIIREIAGTLFIKARKPL